MDRTFPQFRLAKVITVDMFHMRMRELAAMPEEREWKVEGRRRKRRRREGRRSRKLLLEWLGGTEAVGGQLSSPPAKRIGSSFSLHL